MRRSSTYLIAGFTILFSAWTIPLRAQGGKHTTKTSMLNVPRDSTTVGTPVTITAFVDQTGTAAPTGTVTVFDSLDNAPAIAIGTGTVISPDVATATFTTSALQVGKHKFTAAYSGDSNYFPILQSDTTFPGYLAVGDVNPAVTVTSLYPYGTVPGTNAFTASPYNSACTYVFALSNPAVAQLFIASPNSVDAAFSTPGGTGATVTVAGSGCPLSGTTAFPVYGISEATFGQTPNAASVLHPISTATGELFGYDQGDDLALGGPLPLTLKHYYAAYLNGVNSALGASWMHNFDVKLTIASNSGTVRLYRGKTVQFAKSGAVWTLSSTEKRPYQLIVSGADYLFLDPDSNLIYAFNSSGALTGIQDRNGNTLTVTPSANGPAAVSDGLGRTLTFTYSGKTLTKVQDQSGRSVAFAYTGGVLSTFTDANGRSYTYAYTTANFIKTLMTAETKPLGNQPLTQTFDSSARVATQTDSFGNTASFAYSADDIGATVTEPLGVSFTHAHDSQLDLISQTDPSGLSTQRTYDANGHPSSVTDRLSNIAIETTDAASGLPATFTDTGGNVTTYTYSASTVGGLTFFDLASVQAPDATSITFTRDANGNVISVSDQAGQQWSTTRNTRGQPLTFTNPTGAVTTLTYGNDGTLTAVKLASGDTTQIAYDAVSRPNLLTFPDGSTRQFQYDARGNALQLTDERGHHTAAAYDNNNNLKSVTDALAAVNANAYDTNDRVVTFTDALGKATQTSYDAVNRVATVTNAAGNTVTYGYDLLNRVISEVDAAGDGDTFGWDGESRLVTLQDALGRTTKATRDTLGRPTVVSTPKNENYTVAYDGLSRVTNTANPLSESRQYTYDSRGLLASTTLSAGIAGSVTRSALGLITGVKDPDGSIWSSTFDNMGRLATTTDPLGQTTSFQYDSRQRLAGLTFPPAPGGGNSPTAQLSYDATGNLTGETYSDGTTLAFGYDADNRLTSGNGLAIGYDAAGRINQSNGLAITRDAAGRIATITYTPGKVVTYTYNNRGLLTTVTDWVGGSTTLAYDAAGQLTSLTFPNGILENYTYDADGRVATLKATFNGTTLASISLVRDADGKVTSATRSTAQIPAPPQVTYSMTYNQAHEAANQSYDGLGRSTGSSLLGYTWDLASRLTSYSGANGAASFTYDALGQRISRTSPGVTQNYVLNYALGLPAVSVVKSGGSDRTYYVWLPEGTLLESIAATDNSRHFFHFDETGSTQFLSNDIGAVTDTYAMTPFGESVGGTGSTDNPFTFQGKVGVMQDGSTGLYYMRARYYDSSLSRFLSRDPIGSLDPLEMNPYQYARANPMRYNDPIGLWPQTSGPAGWGDCSPGPYGLSFPATDPYLSLDPYKNPFTGVPADTTQCQGDPTTNRYFLPVPPITSPGAIATSSLFPYLTNATSFDTGLGVATASPRVASLPTGSVWAQTASTIAPNFQGYAFAVCNFQFAHGFAFVSDLGARSIAMGYLDAVLAGQPPRGPR